MVEEPFQLVGSSRAIRDVRAAIAKLAPLPWPVRLEGPSGSGKRVVAMLLHRLSPRVAGPFVACHLNMLADGLEIAELTGYVRGAFTGATQDYQGAFETAHGGTLLLDELAAASPRVQAALLQLVEEGTVRRLGERRVRRVEARLVFASNVDLDDAMEAGTFRRDLYYRLGSLVVHLPALSEHREDIPELVGHLRARMSRDLGMTLDPMPATIIERLMAYEWPGNVRELAHAVEHYVAFNSFPPALSKTCGRVRHWREQVELAIAEHDGNKAAAARSLGIARQTLHEELRRRNAS